MAELDLDALGFSRCEKCGTPTEYDANAMVQYHTLTMAPRCPTAREVAEVWAAEVRASDELARQAEALEELVSEVAAQNPVEDDACLACGAEAVWPNDQWRLTHASGCLWLRCVAAVTSDGEVDRG